MMQLLCAIVAAPGSVFPVRVDNSDTVADLKHVIKAESSVAITCDANCLQLFLAKTDGSWLSSCTEDVKKLKKGEKTALIEALTHEVLQLQGDDPIVEVVADMETQTPEQIHLLLVTPQREKLMRQSSRLGSYMYDSGSEYFWLEKNDMEDAGFIPKRLMLYCRPAFHKQVKFLREKVLNEGHLGWVLGPQGTGKSTTALAFALTVDRDEWEVIWIHVENYVEWRCIHLVGGERKTRTIDDTELKKMLRRDDDSKHRLVLVDGWTRAESFSTLKTACNMWFLEKDVMMKRRLVYIYPTITRGKTSEYLDSLTRAMEHPVRSWTLDEYLDATSDDTFFNDILPNLGESVRDRSALVETKYYYAGGSCRYMFGFNTKDVTDALRYAVNVLNGQPAAMDLYISSVNSLFALLKAPYVGTVKPVISQYAATMIAVLSNLDTIRKCESRVYSSDSALNGWMLDVYFFSRIRNGGLEIVDAAGNQIDTWSTKWGQSCVVVSNAVPVLSLYHPVWIKPTKWNQGGCDAIMVCKQTRFVRMVQITSGDTHTFRIEHFYSWLEMFSQSEQSFEIDTLEIIFVVERKKLSNFRLSKVTGEGLLEPFGWQKSTEARRAKKVGVQVL